MKRNLIFVLVVLVIGVLLGRGKQEETKMPLDVVVVTDAGKFLLHTEVVKAKDLSRNSIIVPTSNKMEKMVPDLEFPSCLKLESGEQGVYCETPEVRASEDSRRDAKCSMVWALDMLWNTETGRRSTACSSASSKS